jgi:hypothetical protein
MLHLPPYAFDSELGSRNIKSMLRRCYIALAILSVSGVAIFAQTPSPSPKPVEDAAPNKSVTVPVPAKSFKRWVDIDGLAVSTRYRYVENAAGVITNNQNQYQVNARARFKFDREGRYSVYAGLFSGNNLTSGWANTGIGTGSPQGDVFLKQLYFDAKPVKWLQVQVGGIGANNGENSEITGYDNDVYLTGERVVVRRPKNLYFDEISVTNAYIGDINRPNVFRRFKNFGRSNYHQLLVRKQVNKRVAFSADYTFEAGTDTLRQAVKISAPEAKIFDILHFENYQRVDPDKGYGFSLWGEKVIRKKLNLSGGFARIDRTMFNADRFPRGNRFFIGAAYKLTRELTLNPVLIQAVGPLDAPSLPRTRLDLILTFNVLETLRRLKVY